MTKIASAQTVESELSKAQAAAEQQGFERRVEARYPTNDNAEVEVLPGPGPVLDGRVLDVSRSGLRVALPVAVRKAAQLKIRLQHAVIFGEVRYCRSASGGFHVGVLIQQLERPPETTVAHVTEDLLTLFAFGRGLSVPEVIKVREHLMKCSECRNRLSKTEVVLFPKRRTKLF